MKHILQEAVSLLRLNPSALREEKAELSEFEKTLDQNRIISQRLRSKESDTFRFLRTQILYMMHKHNFKTLAISSPRYGDGKSTICANLCTSIAQDLKQTVLLVDLDLRNPSLSEFMGIAPEKGLTDYLVGRARVEECLVRMPFERFTVFPAGKPVDQSSETLGSPQMEQLAEELKSRYNDRMIIYDMPPLLEQDDPLVFLPHVDCFLLIVKEGITTTEEIKRSMDILEPAKVIGVVLNTA
ncbi:MAG: CpsD/CapB family tyrosine-protein kinase [Alphaproteobacteria bacterium]